MVMKNFAYALLLVATVTGWLDATSQPPAYTMPERGLCAHRGGMDTHPENTIPAFKNATYWSNKQHWDWAVYPNEREKASFLKENILPIEESGQLQFIELTAGIEGKLGECPR